MGTSNPWIKRKRVQEREFYPEIYASREKDVEVSMLEKVDLVIAALKEELQPEVTRVVFKDAGFKDDVVKNNTVQILRQAGIEDVKSL